MARAISQLSPKAQAAYKADPQMAATRAAQVAGSGGGDSATASSSPPMVNMPDLSGFALPGGSMLEKGLIVVGILIVGMGLYSKITGKRMNLGLQGVAKQTTPGTGAQVPAAPGIGSQQPTVLGMPAAVSGPPQTRDPLTPAMYARTAAANPGQVGA